MEIGRNEPCPCGSGKKFKRCCGAPTTDPFEVAAGDLRAVQATAEAKVWRLIRDDLGNDSLNDAREEFEAVAPAEDPDPAGDERDLFRSWILYDWVPGSPLVTLLKPESAELGIQVHAAMCHTIFWSGAIALSSCSSFSTVGIDFPCSYRA